MNMKAPAPASALARAILIVPENAILNPFLSAATRIFEQDQCQIVG
jgi:hypothetical protein